MAPPAARSRSRPASPPSASALRYRAEVAAAQPGRRRCTPPAASRCCVHPQAPDGVADDDRGRRARLGPGRRRRPAARAAATSPPAGRARPTTRRCTTSTRSRTPSTWPWPGSPSRTRIPLLAICRGHPGGQRRARRHLVQDMDRARGRAATTATTCTTSSSTAGLTAARRRPGRPVEISCYHHQCLGRLWATDCVVTARSEEGVIEAVELPTSTTAGSSASSGTRRTPGRPSPGSSPCSPRWWTRRGRRPGSVGGQASTPMSSFQSSGLAAMNSLHQRAALGVVEARRPRRRATAAGPRRP